MNAPPGDEVDVDPVTSLSPKLNVPPMFLLIIARLPVNVVCFRESASKS